MSHRRGAEIAEVVKAGRFDMVRIRGTVLAWPLGSWCARKGIGGIALRRHYEPGSSFRIGIDCDPDLNHAEDFRAFRDRPRQTVCPPLLRVDGLPKGICLTIFRPLRSLRLCGQCSSSPADSDLLLALDPLDCVLEQFGGAIEPELVLDVLAMGVDRLGADVHPFGDLPGRQARADQL
jgi:hypothetical protein